MRGPALLLAIAVGACSDTSTSNGHSDVADGVDGAADGIVGEVSDTRDAGETGTSATDTVGGDTQDIVEEEVEGGFRWPCLENSDCFSGLCIDTDEGSVCTRNCSENCPDGWRCAGVQAGGSDVAFVCTPLGTRLCQPCTIDSQCAGGYCVADASGNRACSRPCGDDDSCPSGFACESLASEADAATLSKQCVPITGRCDCTAANAGEERPCPVENAFGRCWGVELCDGAAGWSACNAAVPGPEACDGNDQNCNGVADESLTPPAEPCEVANEAGTCRGVWTCTGPTGWRCDARVPALETCNYLDDDCDGATDEAFRDAEGRYVSDGDCGVCGNTCTGKIAFATATTCAVVDDAAACIATACAAGYFIPIQTQQACVPLGGGFECSSCFGDPNCSGLTDGRCELLDGGYRCTRGCAGSEDCGEGYTCDGGRCLPRSLSCDCLASNRGNERTCREANAAGICFGNQICDPDLGWSGCTAPVPAAETCNGLDDDCDQQVDDLAPHDPPMCAVTNEFGTCGAAYVCLGAGGWHCDERTPSAESCDGLDNDCNSQTDDGFVDAATGKYLALDHCGACGISCVGALPNATARCGLSPQGTPRCEVARCDAGYFQKGPLACIPASADACIPCATDAACPGGACVTLSDGDFCLNPCDSDANCTPGYSCLAQGGGKLCIPDTQSCRCDGSDLTLLRGCSVPYTPPAGGDAYSCFGTQGCTTAGWDACALGGEECNLLDDDCDGQTDEDFLVDGRFATDDNCGECGNDCTLLTFPGGGGICNTSGLEPRCSLRCGERCFDVNVNPNDGCECCDPAPIDVPDPAGYDANCDGLDGEKDNGIFVAKWGSDAASGAWGEPKRTIQAGILTAVAERKRDVYVATGVYAEAIDLALGIGVYGGYASDFALRNGTLFETALLAPAPTAERPAAVSAIGLAGGTPEATVLDGFAVYGAAVKTAGGSSFAVRLVDCDASVRISQNRIFGGSGGRGRRGGDGTDGADATAGGAGIDAFDVFEKLGLPGHQCGATVSAGGTPGVQQCGAIDTSGGAGGNRVCPVYPDAGAGTTQTKPPVASETGVAGKRGGAAAAAAGGAPGWDVYHQRFSCEGYDTYGIVEGRDGNDGGSGTDGHAGDGCTDAQGSVVGTEWIAAGASGGGEGSHAAGGGGGGSGAGAYAHDSCAAKGLNYDNIGGTGGGGGAGGCSGTPGRGGTSGGGAFAILVLFTAPPTTLPTIVDNVIEGGAGGDGGDGGNGGVGGSGGAGAFGGKGGGDYNPSATPAIVDPDYPAFKGGKGGKGGNGGHGGGGGGGCGGPTYGIYVAGQGTVDLTRWRDDNAFPVVGTGGAGGLGGFSLGEQGGSGVTGPAAPTNF